MNSAALSEAVDKQSVRGTVEGLASLRIARGILGNESGIGISSRD